MESTVSSGEQLRYNSASTPLRPVHQEVIPLNAPSQSDLPEPSIQQSASPDTDKYRSATGTTSPSTSTDSSIADIHKSRKSHTSILLPETRVKLDAEGQSTGKVSRGSDLRKKACNYWSVILRLVKSGLVVCLVLACMLLLSYCLGKDLSQTKTVLSILMLSVILSSYYVFFSTFQSWFYYWDPDFTFSKPS